MGRGEGIEHARRNSSVGWYIAQCGIAVKAHTKKIVGKRHSLTWVANHLGSTADSWPTRANCEPRGAMFQWVWQRDKGVQIRNGEWKGTLYVEGGPASNTLAETKKSGEYTLKEVQQGMHWWRRNHHDALKVNSPVIEP